MHRLERLLKMLPTPGRHVLDDADDDSDHGTCHSKKEAGSVAGKQGKRKRGAAAESSSAGCRLPRGQAGVVDL